MCAWFLIVVDHASGLRVNRFCGFESMKKIKQRKRMVAWMALGIVLLFLGVYGVWDGATHVGPGVWAFGGDEPGTGGALGTDEHQDRILEDQYKRECYVTAVLFLFFGGIVLRDVIKKWKERDGLEKSWNQIISNPDSVLELHKHPDNYRDDFKQWIKDNHPQLAFWELPPNSSN